MKVKFKKALRDTAQNSKFNSDKLNRPRLILRGEQKISFYKAASLKNRLLVEKHWDPHTRNFHNFVDFKKAFHGV